MIDLKIESNMGKNFKLETLSVSLREKIARIMKELTLELNEEIKQTLSTKGTSSDGKVLTSKPFSPPYMQSGNLRSSMEARFLQDCDGQTLIEAGDLSGRAKYAKVLEYGSKNTLPRPFLIPLMKKYIWILKQKIISILKD